MEWEGIDTNFLYCAVTSMSRVACSVFVIISAELPLRVRYYQGMIDQEILSSGTDYIFLKETYIIFICTYDPFEIMSCIYDA